MNKKIISIAAIVVLLAFGFLYVNSSYISAKNKCSGTSCSASSTQNATQDNKVIKAAGDENKTTDCTGKDCIGKGCDKDGKSSGNTMKQSTKSGCPNGCPYCKNKKGKDI